MEKMTILCLFIFMMSMATGIVNAQNIANQFFLKVNFSGLTNPAKIQKAMNLQYINNKLCSPSQTVSCFLVYRVVGELSVVVVLNVADTTEMHRRITGLIAVSKAMVEAKPLVNIGLFAEFLGVDQSLTNFSVNTLENVREALWCEYNINFGGMEYVDAIDLWKEEAGVILVLRDAGVRLELFKTVGERTVHLIMELVVDTFDTYSLITPFGRAIRDNLGLTCKIVNN